MTTQNEITIKEVYERVVALEIKFDTVVNNNHRTTKKFTGFVYFLILMILIDMFIDILILFK